MGLFDGITNPWANGGLNGSSPKWAQPGQEHGWVGSDSTLNPPTKEQQREHENLQLAIVAASAVAPDMVAEEQRNGGGTQQVEFDPDSVAPSPQSSAVNPSELYPSQVPNGGGGAFNSPYGSAHSAVGTVLTPFKYPNSTEILRRAAIAGERHLNEALHRFSGRPDLTIHGAYMREYHASITLLLGLVEEIGKNVGLRHELRQLASFSISRLSRPSLDRISRLVRENLPMENVSKALESVMDIERPKRKHKMSGPVGVVADPRTSTINGTIYLEFDNDFSFGEDDMAVTMNRTAYEVQDSICTKLQANSFNGQFVVSNIKVIPVPLGQSAPNGAHVFIIGNGLHDKRIKESRGEEDDDREENPRISWVNGQRSKEGYLYQTDAAGHETMHWLGLSDRYTEVVHIDGSPYSEGDRNPLTALWGRPFSLFLPLANVQGYREVFDYDPLTNVMSVNGLTLTQFQLHIIFSNRTIEAKYPRDVVAVGPYVENIDMPNHHQHKVEEAVEFVGHEAIWWYVEEGSPEENRPKRRNEYTRPPITIRRLGNAYFGQNFDVIRRVVYDSDHTQDFDNLEGTIKGNRKEVNKAIHHNQ